MARADAEPAEADPSRHDRSSPTQEAVRRARAERIVTVLTLMNLSAPVALVVIAVLTVISWLAAYYLGGGTNVAPHWFYIPVFLAGLRFGPIGALVTAVVSTFVCGPLLPADVATNTPQATSDWVSRGIFFLVIGQFVTQLFIGVRRMSVRETHLQTEVELSAAELEAREAQAAADSARAEQTRARLESELRQAQRMEAVGQLAGGVAHDFNNLLAVILTYGDFIAEELGEDHPVQGDLAEVRKAAARAAELTRQLLIFSRRDLINPTVVDVNATITDLLNILSRTLTEEIRLEPVLATELPCVLADSGELEQVLVNLVVNARDAIAGAGKITVETSTQVIDEDIALIHADLRPGRYVRIAVTDTGCGMTPEVASQIFEPFFTTKGPGSGTGLGLSTVYGIANRYGGCVTVYSEPDVGTCFKVYLPATDNEFHPVIPTDSPTDDATASGETVLLVEDEEAVRSACKRILERAGFQVLEASSGAQALAELGDQPVDLLLTDVIMPGGLTGRELAERLHADRPELPVLFMSGYNADAISTRGVLDPGITVVEKPFTSSDLIGKVRALLP